MKVEVRCNMCNFLLPVASRYTEDMQTQILQVEPCPKCLPNYIPLPRNIGRNSTVAEMHEKTR